MVNPLYPIGLVFGYYNDRRFVRVITNTMAPNGCIGGYRFYVFMIGFVTDINVEKNYQLLEWESGKMNISIADL